MDFQRVYDIEEKIDMLLKKVEDLYEVLRKIAEEEDDDEDIE